jgi:hypothetical protein
MMAAAKYDFMITKGLEFKRLITWRDAAGDYIDPFDYTVAMDIRDTTGANVIVTSLGASPDINIELVGELCWHLIRIYPDQVGLTNHDNKGGALARTVYTAPYIDITIPAAVTEDFDFETAVYDLKLSSSNRNIRLLEGNVKLLEAV